MILKDENSAPPTLVPEDATERSRHTEAIEMVSVWPAVPEVFEELLTPVEAAMYLRLHELGSHTPLSAVRTLNFWRGKGQLKATKFARRVWYRKAELDRFLKVKTET
jgi:hypothetical protein